MRTEAADTMRCEQCDALWQLFEHAVFEHVRLCSKLKLAIATNNETASEGLMRETQAAERKRADARAALMNHQAAFGHQDADSLASKSAL